MGSLCILCVALLLCNGVIVVEMLSPNYNIYELSQCPLQIEPIGCYEDSRDNRVLPDQLMNSRDSMSKVFGLPVIDWKNYNQWLSNYICECGKKLLKKKGGSEGHIGIQFYAECWGNLAQDAKPIFGKESSKCVNGDYQQFSSNNMQKCEANVGKGHANFVYKVSKYYRTCPEIAGTFNGGSKSYKLDINDNMDIVGSWLSESKPQFQGELLRGCHGKLTMDGITQSFDYNTKTCKLNLQNGDVMTKQNCEKVDECPYFRSYGCYKDLDPRTDANFELYAFNERDHTNENWSGRYIQWKKWGTTYLVDLVCRCAQKAMEHNKRFFSLQYLGECWVTNDEVKMTRHGNGTECFDRHWGKCKDDGNMCKPKPCAGDRLTNKIYEIHQGPMKCLENPCPTGQKCMAEGATKYKCIQ